MSGFFLIWYFVFLPFVDSAAPNRCLTCTARLWSSSSAGWGSWACPPSPPPSRSPRRNRTGRWSCGDARRTVCQSRDRRAGRSCTPPARAPGSAAGLCGISAGCSCCRRLSLAWCRPPHTPSAGSHTSRTGRSPALPSDTGSGHPRPKRKLGGSGEPIKSFFFTCSFSAFLSLDMLKIILHWLIALIALHWTLNLIQVAETDVVESTLNWEPTCHDGGHARHLNVPHQSQLEFFIRGHFVLIVSWKHKWGVSAQAARAPGRVGPLSQLDATTAVGEKYERCCRCRRHKDSTFVKAADQQKTLVMFPCPETLSSAPSWNPMSMSKITHLF